MHAQLHNLHVMTILINSIDLIWGVKTQFLCSVALPQLVVMHVIAILRSRNHTSSSKLYKTPPQPKAIRKTDCLADRISWQLSSLHSQCAATALDICRERAGIPLQSAVRRRRLPAQSSSPQAAASALFVPAGCSPNWAAVQYSQSATATLWVSSNGLTAQRARQGRAEPWLGPAVLQWTNWYIKLQYMSCSSFANGNTALPLVRARFAGYIRLNDTHSVAQPGALPLLALAALTRPNSDICREYGAWSQGTSRKVSRW